MTWPDLETLRTSGIIMGAGKLALIIVLWIATGRSRSLLVALMRIVLIILVLRIILFENGYAWRLYDQTLSTNDVGFRQKIEIKNRADRFRRYPFRPTYLAFGSSQIWPLYERHSVTHPDFALVFIAGGGPVRYRPETVLLYLSGLDMATQPMMDGLKISPGLGWELLTLWPDLQTIAKACKQELGFKELIASHLVPEYKYAFIFKAFMKKAIGRSRLKQPTLTEIESNEPLDLKIAALAGSLWEKAIPVNLDFLRRFLTFCRRHGIRVVIVEGQYHPGAYTPKNQRLNALTRRHLEAIAREFDHVRFIPKEETVVFTAEDYKDATHVQAGPRTNEFVERVLEQLDASTIKGEGPS